METREIDIRKYWPPVVRDTDEFQQIASAENPEFNKLVQCIYRVLQDAFVLYGTEYGVSRWESSLGIVPAAGASLDERKAAILAYLCVKLPYSWRVVKQMLSDYLTNEQWSMEYINDEGKLILRTDNISEDKMQTIKVLLANVLPKPIEVIHYNSKEVTENE